MSAYSQKRTFKHPATSVGSIPLDCYLSSWGFPVSEKGVERRLTTILVADVVGYSRLMGADEAGTLAQLQTNRKELIEPKTAEYHGRVVKLMGDGTLMEFGSVVDAVNFAADVQRAMVDWMNAVPEDRRIAYRMGINIGDVIVEGDDIYGDGVNLAARLERLADSGGICLSREAYNQVEGKVPLTFEILGEQTVKNFEKPIGVLKVQIADAGYETESQERSANSTESAGGLKRARARPPIAPFDKAAIVVLPFENLSGDPEQEYFCDGLTHDVTTDLSKFANLLVVAAHSAFSYKRRHVKPQVLHRQLGVRYVLEGSVQKRSRRVRVNAQLINAEQGHHLWAQRFDRDFKDLFELQDELIEKIVVALALRVGEFERQRALRQPPQDMNAYDALLKGSYVYSNESVEGLDHAAYWYRTATEIDPSFARAWGELSYVLVQYVIAGWKEPDTLQVAGNLGRKAVRLDDSDYYNHWNLGFYYLHTGQFDHCDIAFREALALNGNDADLLVEMGEALICMGELEQGIEQIHKAIRINPHAPDWYYWTLALGHHCAKAYDEAVQSLDCMVDTPKWSLLLRGVIQAQGGDLGQGASTMKSFLRHMPEWTIARERIAIRFKRREDEEHWFEGLRKAGLPD